MKRLLHKIFTISFGFLVLLSCRSKLEYKIDAAIRDDDHVQTAILCTNYKEERYKEECEESFQKADAIIQEVISKKIDFPFTKLIVEDELNKKVLKLLEINYHFGVRYASIWKETVEIKEE